MKYPNCGSTAQPKLVATNGCIKIYKCGCGTKFQEKS